METRQKGFTLPELMIVLALAATVLAIAAPNFSEFRVNNRLTSSGNDFLGAVSAARTEAIKRQVPVAVCPSADPRNAAATCTAGAFTGWIVFVDTDNDCVRDAGEELLRGDGPLDPALTASSNGVCASFAGSGFLQNIAGRATASRTLFCDERGAGAQAGTDQSMARGVFVTQTGRARVTRDISSGVTTDLSTWGIACP
jgi:type IV fimbrial biogenesis protein FimT